MKRLNRRQEDFCLEFIKNGGNGTKAAMFAGYADKSAGQMANKLLKNPKIIQWVEHLRGKIEDELNLSFEAVAKEFAAIGFCKVTDFVRWGRRLVPKEKADSQVVKDSMGIVELKGREFYQVEYMEVIESDDLTPEAAAAIEEIKLTPTRYGQTLSIRMHSKETALANIAKMHGWFEIESPAGVGPDGQPIQNNFVMIAPAPVTSVEEWLKKIQPLKEANQNAKRPD